MTTSGANAVTILRNRSLAAVVGDESLTQEPASLWEMLLNDFSPEERVATLGLSANHHVSRYIVMRELCNRQRTITEKVVVRELPSCFVSRLIAWQGIDFVVREKVLRWEIVKMQMIHGRHENGVVCDSGAGRSIRVPLRMATSLTTEKTFATRMATLEEHAVRDELFSLWNDISARGGINKATYFAMAKEVCHALLVHLDARAIHQMVSMDALIDLPEWGGVMTKRSFLRYVASLMVVWIETDATAEALNFVRKLAWLWRRKVDELDHKFVNLFSRKDDPSPLVPILPSRALTSLEALMEFAKRQLEMTSKVRFGALASDEPVWQFGKLRRKAHRFREQHASGAAFFMTPEKEPIERAGLRLQDEEVVACERGTLNGNVSAAAVSSLRSFEAAPNTESGEGEASPLLRSATGNHAVFRSIPHVASQFTLDGRSNSDDNLMGLASKGGIDRKNVRVDAKKKKRRRWKGQQGDDNKGHHSNGHVSVDFAPLEARKNALVTVNRANRQAMEEAKLEGVKGVVVQSYSPPTLSPALTGLLCEVRQIKLRAPLTSVGSKATELLRFTERGIGIGAALTSPSLAGVLADRDPPLQLPALYQYVEAQRPHWPSYGRRAVSSFQ